MPIIRWVTMKFMKSFKNTANTFYISYDVLHMFDDYDTLTSTLKCKIARFIGILNVFCEKWDLLSLVLTTVYRNVENLSIDIFTGRRIERNFGRDPRCCEGEVCRSRSHHVCGCECNRRSLLHRRGCNPTINNGSQKKICNHC